MLKPLIFPRSVVLALALLAAQTVAAQSDGIEASLAAKKPAHQQAIQKIESERLAFQRDLAAREEICLKRFFSASCMDDIRAEHLREMRRFDLAREAELQALRDIDAELRKISRDRRLQDKQKGQAS